jgi:hypothetical protein
MGRLWDLLQEAKEKEQVKTMLLDWDVSDFYRNRELVLSGTWACIGEYFNGGFLEFGYPQQILVTNTWAAKALIEGRLEPDVTRGAVFVYDDHKYQLRDYCACRGTWLAQWPD